MERKKAIEIIKALYPPDTDTGKELLEQAKNDCNSWENLPDNVLSRYATLCEEFETREVNKWMRN